MVKRLLLVMMVACLGMGNAFAKSSSRLIANKAQNKKEFAVKNLQSLKSAVHQEASEVQLSSKDIAKGRKTAFADGLYYNRPGGTLYQAWDKEGMGYRAIRLLAPPFKECSFKTYAPASADTLGWEFRYPSATHNVYEYFNKQDSTFTMPELYGGYGYCAPVMIQGVSEFQLGEKSKLYTSLSDYPRYIASMETETMSFFDDHTSVINYMGWGVLDNYYLFGSGTYKGDKAIGFSQEFEAPAGPMYVDDIFASVISFSENPIPEGKEARMVVYNPETKEVYARLTATAEDLVLDEEESPYSTDYGDVYFFNITFSHKVEDEFGSLTIEPFTIDGPFVVETDLTDEGVDIGFRGCMNPDEDAMIEAYELYEKDGEVKGFSYKTPLSVNLSFTAFFDGAQVYGAKTEEGYIDVGDAEVKIETDGTSEDYALVRTAVPWYGFEYDEDGYLVVLTDGEEQYFLDELPDWVTSVYADVSEWDGDDLPAFNALYFECEALPKGVDGRAATLKVVGRGIESEQTITLLQGNATGINDIAVKNVVNNGKAMYNLSGQRVSKNYKGVILREGKKYLNK
ncbi:MAG: hypothetical protein KBS94_06740 [Prevotella sp.]|nr:hypothetical protein [Candidatus Equicola faecalis]